MHMSPNCQSEARRIKYALLVTALAPALPQILGSAFNIWYNIAVVDPLLVTAALKRRFLQTVVVYNSICYPIGFYLWVRLVYSLRPVLERLEAGEERSGCRSCPSAPARDPYCHSLGLSLPVSAGCFVFRCFSSRCARWITIWTRACFGICRFPLGYRVSSR